MKCDRGGKEGKEMTWKGQINVDKLQRRSKFEKTNIKITK